MQELGVHSPYLLSWADWCSRNPLLPMFWHAYTHTLFPHVARSRKGGDFTLIYFLTAAPTDTVGWLIPSSMLPAHWINIFQEIYSPFVHFFIAWLGVCHLSLKHNVMWFLYDAVSVLYNVRRLWTHAGFSRLLTDLFTLLHPPCPWAVLGDSADSSLPREQHDVACSDTAGELFSSCRLRLLPAYLQLREGHRGAAF